jgi:hypothetical protein
MRNGKAADESPSVTESFLSSWRSWLLAALLIAGLVIAALHWGDVKEFGKLLTEARPGWLAVAAALQLATYFGLAAQWWLVLRKGRTPEGTGDLLRLTFAKHFADQVVPTAGLSGNVLVVDRLVSLGVPRSNAVAALLLQVIAYYLLCPGRAVGARRLVVEKPVKPAPDGCRAGLPGHRGGDTRAHLMAASPGTGAHSEVGQTLVSGAQVLRAGRRSAPGARP